MNLSIKLNISPKEILEEALKDNGIYSTIRFSSVKVLNMYSTIYPSLMEELSKLPFNQKKKVPASFIISNIHRRLDRITEGYLNRDIVKESYFCNISLPPNHFQRVVLDKTFSMKTGKGFMDIGCGTGNNLELAYFYMKKGYKIKGIEHDPLLARIASHILRAGYEYESTNIDILNKDVFATTKTDYKGYDRIYTYMPVEDFELRKKFYQHIFSCLEKGARWIEVQDIKIFSEALANKQNCKFLSERPIIVEKL